MKNFLTLNNKLDFSLIALAQYVMSNLGKIIMWAFTIYLIPTYEMIAVMQFLLFIDFLTGVWKAKKQGESITSKRMADSITKVILYTVGIIVTYVLQHHIGKDMVNIMFLFGALICTRETKSIMENIEIITKTKIWFIIKDSVLSITKKIKNDTES